MVESETTPRRPSNAANLRVAAMGAGIALTMLGAAYAAVPLYDLFCRVTGFGGTTQRADVAPDTSQVLDRRVTIRFDSNVSGGLGWHFKPVQRTIEVKVG
ncbi:MAG: cytochrome c oxidase assembly protein, partial [Pseudomonadota bacterium]